MPLRGEHCLGADFLGQLRLELEKSGLVLMV